MTRDCTTCPSPGMFRSRILIAFIGSVSRCMYMHSSVYVCARLVYRYSNIGQLIGILSYSNASQSHCVYHFCLDNVTFAFYNTTISTFYFRDKSLSLPGTLYNTPHIFVGLESIEFGNLFSSAFKLEY